MVKCLTLTVLILAALCGATALRAQDESCGLGAIKEHVPPRYPYTLQGRIVEGNFTFAATFAPDGRVSASRYVSGPALLKFEAQSYLNGWRAAPGALRQCLIHLDYRFDGSQGVCKKTTAVSVRAERIDESNVTLHLSCDIF